MFLDSLLESLPMARMLHFVDYLPGYSHTWADETYYTRIRVDLLPSTGADEFLQRFLGNGEDFVPLKQHLIKRREESFRYRGECSVSCRNWRVDWRERARINQRQLSDWREYQHVAPI